MLIIGFNFNFLKYLSNKMTRLSGYDALDIVLYIIIGANIVFGTVTFVLTLLTRKNKDNEYLWLFFYSCVISFILAAILLPLMFFSKYNFTSLIRDEAKKRRIKLKHIESFGVGTSDSLNDLKNLSVQFFDINYLYNNYSDVRSTYISNSILISNLDYLVNLLNSNGLWNQLYNLNKTYTDIKNHKIVSNRDLTNQINILSTLSKNGSLNNVYNAVTAMRSAGFKGM